MRDNNFIKKHEIVRVSPQGIPKFMDIITVNITTLSDSARSWLASQTADIILIQEHRCLTRRQFGMIIGFEVIFSPARRTMLSGRGWESSGGVAILYRRNGLYIIKDRWVKSKGHAWVSIRFQHEKAQEMIIMNTYTKHGWDLETQVTFEEAQGYLSAYAIPWLWGGDFNRTAEELLSKGLYLSAHAHLPKDTNSTCVVGGRLIDYFLTPVISVGSVRECTKIVQTRIRPHEPVRILVDRRPHFTRVLAPVEAKKWPMKVVGPMFPKPS